VQLLPPIEELLVVAVDDFTLETTLLATEATLDLDELVVVPSQAPSKCHTPNHLMQLGFHLVSTIYCVSIISRLNMRTSIGYTVPAFQAGIPLQFTA